MEASGRSKPGGGIDGVLDHLVGPDATFTERILVVGTAAGLATVTIFLAGEWTTLQYAVAVLVALDLGGGIVANATHSGKSWFHRDERSPSRRFAFVAGHVHPFAISVVFAPIDPLYGGVVYLGLLAATAVVLWAPRSLKPSFAFAAVTALVVVDGILVVLPAGIDWFVPVFALKLLVGHLVQKGDAGS